MTGFGSLAKKLKKI